MTRGVHLRPHSRQWAKPNESKQRGSYSMTKPQIGLNIQGPEKMG